MNTISTPHEVDWNTVKAKHRTIWESGDYAAVADDLLPEMGVALVEACSVGPGDHLLDLAAGTGNVALPAAAAGAQVVASDLAPALVVEGERLAEQRGLSIDWHVADAEELPYDDGQFDVVTSCLGIMFAPRHEVAAEELLRVTKPGGRIGLVNWTPEGFIGRMFGVMKQFAPAPPPGASPPPAWGNPDYVASLLGDGVRNVAFERRSLGVDQFSTAAELRDYLKRNYGPTIAVYAHISGDSQQVRALDAALDELIGSCMTPAGTTQHMDWEYLLYTAERA